MIPFGDVVAKIGAVEPEHKAGIRAKFGATFGFTLMVKVVFVAHSPAVGVKVYKVVAVLFRPGNQVPVIPLIEVVGNGAITEPLQTAGTGLNVGVTLGFTIIIIVVAVAH